MRNEGKAVEVQRYTLFAIGAIGPCVLNTGDLGTTIIATVVDEMLTVVSTGVDGKVGGITVLGSHLNDRANRQMLINIIRFEISVRVGVLLDDHGLKLLAILVLKIRYFVTVPCDAPYLDTGFDHGFPVSGPETHIVDGVG